MNTKVLRYGKGLGSIFDPSTPIVSLPPTTAQPATSTSFFDKLNAGITAAANTVKTVQNTVSSFNPPSSSAPAANATAAALTPNVVVPNTPQGLSTGAKIGIGVGAVVLLGSIAYVVTRKTKK